MTEVILRMLPVDLRLGCSEVNFLHLRKYFLGCKYIEIKIYENVGFDLLERTRMISYNIEP